MPEVVNDPTQVSQGLPSSPTSPRGAHVDRSTRPPGPPMRGAGVFARIRYGLNFLLDPLSFVGKRFERYGDAYFVESSDQPGLFVFRDPEDIWQVLVGESKNFRKTHSAFRELGEVLGDSGLLTTDGERWRTHRRIVQPAFSPRRMDGYARVMIREAVAEASRWRPGQTLDVSEAMMELTLRIVARTLFGHEVSAPNDGHGSAAIASADTVEAVRAAMRTLQEGMITRVVALPRWLDRAGRRKDAAIATLDELIARMIVARRSQPPGQHDDLLQRLLEARDDNDDVPVGKKSDLALTDREIRDHLVTFFLAGHETTSNALTWTFHLLGQNPSQRARLEAHLDEVLGDRDPTPDDFPRLGFATQVFEESMRLYPPVFISARQAAEPVSIGRWHLPAGSEVVLWIWHTHHDGRLYPDPERFDPDRFTAEAKAARPRGAYLPFGLGPRTCVGKHFATMEGTLLLATLARRWRLESTGNRVKLHPRVTLSPKNGLPMTAHRRA